ncbi:UvrD-helicase domain-containing protein [Colwellia sp. E2M01]|uniref:UvrD-helicase domain-containing protein n=1 Tax=Colwellia sp. E2M01 TaxID=2841561 RepID=UPI001C08CED4|nr:UvrD-helicase domain-containing protein [Colwellia sp. E2M01]MBU2872330.1 UvrD-helicase domain-containing protein [Colwellia sp. E2M01]
MSTILHRNFWGKWFGKAKSITISATGISLVDIDNNAKQYSINQLTDFPTIEAAALSKSLVIRSRTDTALTTSEPTLNGSHKSKTSKIWGINKHSVNLFDNEAKKPLYAAISKNIEQHADAFHKEAISQYLRDSSVISLQQSITPFLENYRKSKTVWQGILTKQQLSKIDVISRMPAITDVKSYRQSYEKKVLQKYSDFFDDIESNPLTQEQRLAVIRNNDKNLILAAAGTGKTSVMVAKALHLIIHNKVPAHKVLILAYNNAAANELKERIEKRKSALGLRYDSPQVLTFHALGLQILNAVNDNTRVSELALDSSKLTQWLADWLVTYLTEQGENTIKMQFFILLAHQVIASFSLNKHSNYKAKISEIEQLVQKDGLAINFVGQVLIILRTSGLLTEMSKSYVKYLQAILIEKINKTEIESRLTDRIKESSKGEYLSKINISELAEFLNVMAQDYVMELKKQDTIDFDDMVHNACSHVKSGSFIPLWSDILVDEFQDISSARMHLLNEIINQGPNPKLTVVGDDWQSIYRFSGGQLLLITQFEKYLGSHSLTTLQKTFRYNNSIADTAGQFIMKNPEQYTKNIDSHHKVAQSQVFLTGSDFDNIGMRVWQIVKRIIAHDPTANIAILARYRYLLANAKTVLDPMVNNGTKQQNKHNIHYWTFHSAKGLEADFCIIVGLFHGSTGFPSINKDDHILEALLPSRDGFKHSEERRLFYVALTRAKHKAYLIADPNKPSAFVEELLAPSYGLQLMSNEFDELRNKLYLSIT